MRILYVALTRAKEKLIVTGIKKDYEKQKEKLLAKIQRYQKQDKKINPILIKKYIKYIDWILLTYFYENDKMQEIAEFKTYTKKQILDFCEKKQVKKEDHLALLRKQKVEKTEVEKIEKIVKTTYLYESSTKIPTKSSVTKMKQKNEGKLETNFETPKFMIKQEDSKLTGSQKGTLLHLCMQKLDQKQDYDSEKIKQLVEELQKKEIITEKEAKNINLKAILKFTKSKIWEEMRQAKLVEKEKPFYITIPAKEIYEEEVEESVLVQGMIDLYYINQNDELILVDYKTDFVEKEDELILKYQDQLDRYRQALEEALGQKVEKVFIYSTFFGKELEVG